MIDPVNVQIPPEADNIQLPDPNLPDPNLLSIYKEKEERCFWIDEEISSQSLEICRLIIQWNREDENLRLPPEQRKPIKFFFFSPGGDLDVNYTIIDTIRMSETPINGINMGSCCSAAAYIYLACHKRFMLPHAYFLFHQGSGAFNGSYLDILSQIQYYQEQVEELSSIMKESTKYTDEELADNITGEWYVRASEALEKGVCHEVVNDIKTLL